MSRQATFSYSSHNSDISDARNDPPAHANTARTVEFDKTPKEVYDELRKGPLMASTVGLASEVIQSLRDQMLARTDSKGGLFGDGKGEDPQVHVCTRCILPAA